MIWQILALGAAVVIYIIKTFEKPIQNKMKVGKAVAYEQEWAHMLY